MKALWLALLLLAAPTFASSDTLQEEAAALAYVCNYLAVDCRREEIELPEVIRTVILDDLGLWGAHVPSEKRIFLGTKAPPHTLVHEMVHYVLWNSTVKVTRCESEYISRIVAAVWGGQIYDSTWRARYGC